MAVKPPATLINPLIFYPEELKNDTLIAKILDDSSQTGHVLFCRVNAVSSKLGSLKQHPAIIAEMRHVQRRILNDAYVLYTDYALCLARDLLLKIAPHLPVSK